MQYCPNGILKKFPNFKICQHVPKIIIMIFVTMEKTGHGLFEPHYVLLKISNLIAMLFFYFIFCHLLCMLVERIKITTNYLWKNPMISLALAVIKQDRNHSFTRTSTSVIKTYTQQNQNDATLSHIRTLACK